MLWASGSAEEVLSIDKCDAAECDDAELGILLQVGKVAKKQQDGADDDQSDPAEREMKALLQGMANLQTMLKGGEEREVDADQGVNNNRLSGSPAAWPQEQLPALGGTPVPKVDGKYPLLADYLRSKGVKEFLPDQVPKFDGPQDDLTSKGADTKYWEKSLEEFNELVEQGGHLTVTAHTMGYPDGSGGAWHALLIFLVSLDGRTLHVSTGYGIGREMREDANARDFDITESQAWSFLEHNKRWHASQVGLGYGHSKMAGALGTVTRNFTDGRGVDNMILPDVCAMIKDNAIHWESDPAILKNAEWPKVWKLLEAIANKNGLIYYAYPTGMEIVPPWPFWQTQWTWSDPKKTDYMYRTDDGTSSFAMCCFDFINYFMQELHTHNFLISSDYEIPACGAHAVFEAEGWKLAMTLPVVCFQS